MLYIAAKAPRPGLAKTRLARAIGNDAALGLYRGFVADLAARFSRAPFPVGWYVTPPDAWNDLAPLLGARERWGGVLAQGEGDWTRRQEELFRGAAARGEERVVLAASDSPQLDIGTVLEALDRLRSCDLVLGPTSDGGYYLLGMRGWCDVLGGVEMSTDTVAARVLAAARARGLAVGLLPPMFDVDEARDIAPLCALARSRPDLPATGAALALLGGAGGREVGVEEGR